MNFPSRFVSTSARWLGRHRRTLATALGLLVATVAAAFALPVDRRDIVGASRAPLVDDAWAASAIAVEDLTPLLETVRWGTSLREMLAAASQAAATAAPASVEVSATALSDVRFVGYIAAPARRSALLALPDGQVVRLAPGERLRDGRTVAAVSNRSLTLAAPDAGAQVLPLFPPVQVSSPPLDADASPESR